MQAYDLTLAAIAGESFPNQIEVGTELQCPARRDFAGLATTSISWAASGTGRLRS